jgi:hypothetical protein
MMNKSRRKEGDSHWFTAEGKKYYVVDGPLPTPNKMQIKSAMFPIDRRYKRTAAWKYFLFWLGIALIVFAIIRSL